MEGSVFWKISSFKKAALQKKYLIGNIAFLKCYLFPKCSLPEKVNAVENFLRRKSRSSVDILILNNSSSKKMAIPKSNCTK